MDVEAPTRVSGYRRVRGHQSHGWQVTETHLGMVILKLTDEDGTVLSAVNQQRLYPAMSFMFSVHDVDSLRHHITESARRNLAWQKEMTTVTSRLLDEIERHGDLMMVKGMDVYRNLPEKVLSCHQWIHERYSAGYVLKTDDDCYINVPEVIKSLQSNLTGGLGWRGSFRKNWPVERHGKWREGDFSSSVYPKFACGSGNVVSYAVHSWLVQNKDVLKKFQGEDVSLGIWMSVLLVDYIQDDRWRCDLSCQDDLLSLPELTPDMVIWHWNNSRNCQTPCKSC